MDHDQRYQQTADTGRMFRRALWLKANLPITPDEWALLCALIFGDLPEKQATDHELERARAHYAPLRKWTAVPIDDPARAELREVSLESAAG